MKKTNLRLLDERLALSDGAIDFSLASAIPSRERVISILWSIIRLIFPRLYAIDEKSATDSESLFLSLASALSSFVGENPDLAEQKITEILYDLPKIKSSLTADAVAIYEGDPAATSPLEVMRCYPGFLAIMIQRISHAFYLRNIPYLPRMMTEYAHERTGIDIHPGARIGESFCIDHGTGVVIGETAEIGDRVKIYQGVTIGAKSFEKDHTGRLIKGKKRHPKIGNDCIIYAGATILGGDTVVGDGCIVGGNVWLTHSLAPGEKIYYS